MADDADIDLTSPGIPEPAADSVLAIGFYFQFSVACLYLLMDNLFQHPGGNPLVFSFA